MKRGKILDVITGPKPAVRTWATVSYLAVRIVHLRYYARGRGSCSACESHQHADVRKLAASVGEGGHNVPNDVGLVQSKLNEVAPEVGGPSPPLAVDSICGPKTKGAILQFQRRYPGELVSDGRIDCDKATWKKLAEVSEQSNEVPVLRAKTPKSPTPPPAAVDDATQHLFTNYLWLTRHRIFETIKTIDTSIEELKLCRAYVQLHPGVTLFRAYKHWEIRLTELPTFDRCFHIVSDKMEYTKAEDILLKVRRVYVHMVDVIVANSFTTPEAEKFHSRQYLRVVEQKFLDWDHGRDRAMADAPLGGWWLKNANTARIRYGSGHIADSDAFTTLIHEMAHFVSHSSTFRIDHEGGIYNAAFNATAHQAVHNAFCYEWYAKLACFKSQRDTPNSALVLD
jgi:hypothetical protein